jgi:hypothetical protein
MGLRLVSETVPKLTGKVFSRKYIALGKVVSCWEEIVGREMASRASPVKIHYRKPKPGVKKPEATLEIAATSSDATLMQYQTGVILERINHIFGDKWITAIRFVHIPANAKVTNPVVDIAKRTQDTSGNEEYLSTILDEVTDTEIKERLGKLGSYILRKQADKI